MINDVFDVSVEPRAVGQDLDQSKAHGRAEKQQSERHHPAQKPRQHGITLDFNCATSASNSAIRFNSVLLWGRAPSLDRARRAIPRRAHLPHTASPFSILNTPARFRLALNPSSDPHSMHRPSRATMSFDTTDDPVTGLPGLNFVTASPYFYTFHRDIVYE